MTDPTHQGSEHLRNLCSSQAGSHGQLYLHIQLLMKGLSKVVKKNSSSLLVLDMLNSQGKTWALLRMKGKEYQDMRRGSKT